MKNPYIILDLKPDADKGEIMKAQMLAMKKKEYPLQEIQLATRQLLDPVKRLIADFMFPTKVKSKRLQPIQTDLKFIEINLNIINENAFDSADYTL